MSTLAREGTSKFELACTTGLGLLALVVLAWPNAPDRRTLDSRDLEDLMVAGLIPSDPIALFMAIDIGLEGTEYEGKYVINETPEESELCIVVFDSSEPEVAFHPHLAQLQRNAVFLSSVNAIVVDVKLIEELANRYFKHEGLGARATLLQWVIGHEIGHLVRGHPSSHFWSSEFLATSSADEAVQRRENEADEYFAEVLAFNGQDALDPYLGVFLTILAHEKGRGPRETGSHPTFLHRSVRFLQSIASSLEDDELAEQVAALAAHIELDTHSSD